MNNMRTRISITASLAAASALILLLVSCQDASTSSPHTTTRNVSSEQLDNKTNKEDPHRNNSKPSSHTNKDDTKAKVEIESNYVTWAASSPSLYGISIGNTETEVQMLYGKQSDSYMLGEEHEQIKVLEYDGFAVGLNGDQYVQYIEVFGKDISAGLSGLRVGDNPEAALQALGTPDTATTYLLTYIADGALLKLDINPEQDEIVSIKLLSVK